jgi:hypothetical protein
MPASGTGAGPNVEVDGGRGKATLRTWFPSEVFIQHVIVSDKDRPETRFGAKQNSHTVAWTLIRSELADFANSRLPTSCHFSTIR